MRRICFTIDDTNLAKGVALCLLLIHHLFYSPSNNYVDIMVNGRQFSNIVSEFSKVCVAMFVLLSGYGLNESTDKKQYTNLSFYKKHLSKIYSNYWFIWVAFVPVGILYFNISLESVYDNNVALKIILNILGVQNYFGFYGYNATWWFIGAIVPLYIMFPLLKKLTYKYKKWALIISFSTMYIPYIPSTISDWIFPFVLGIFSSQNDLFYRVKKIMSTKPISKLSIYISTIIFIMLFRHYGFGIIKGVHMDGIFALFIIFIGFEYLSKNSFLKRIMIFIGVHSFNIFLFHTFIYFYYFPVFSYRLKYPLLIFLQLLLICLTISIILEGFKKIISRIVNGNIKVS
ncbi:acyltransferase family protein [Propionispira raffinosivorans]|uniref:acyltransferase family protein n=1 Tax=Propionispira raffinosivorans TaxID=86959 RepID=UPI000369476D|nr:acyltransferase family protein [Propionispira raffinosivorans]